MIYSQLFEEVFEGDSLLIPALHPEVDMGALPKLYFSWISC